jgi:hypothetical protein
LRQKKKRGSRMNRTTHKYTPGMYNYSTPGV